MARPLSEEKRGALLDAAVDAVAELGLAAPTAKIAKSAGVGDGTLFVYFSTKEQLFNQLYLHIKRDLRKAVEISIKSGVEEGFRQFWDAYISWGMKFPNKYRASRYLNSWEKLLDETRSTSWEIFSDFKYLVSTGIDGQIIRVQPEEFVGQLVDSIANMVIEHYQNCPSDGGEWRILGWRAFWEAIRA